jgi:hypothetical protein
MTNSILWQSFSALTNLERKHLGQWLESPFFCRRPQPGLLFQYLQQCLDKDKMPDLQEAKKRTKTQADQDFRLLMSEVQMQLEHFLVYKEYFEQEENFHIRLAAAWRKRGLDKHFRRALRQARQDWERQPYRHNDYFDAQAGIALEEYQYLSSSQRTEALNLQELLDVTDTAYITQKLRQACFALTHQTVYNAEYRMGLLEAVLQHIRLSPELLELPAVALYYFCYLFLTEPDEEKHFSRFRELLLTHSATLPPDEQRDLHLLAINYCIKKINQMQSAYFRQALELYQSALRADLLLENGTLSPFAYNNIVAIALKVGERAWAEHFVRQYAPFLEKKHREANYQLNLARVAYTHKDYRKALLHLQEADYKDLINNLIAKTLLLKIFFETGEYDALDAHLQSMQGFLRRQRVIGYHRDNYRNIIRLTRRIMQHNPNNPAEAAALKNQIGAENPLTEKAWLLEMLAGERV